MDKTALASEILVESLIKKKEELNLTCAQIAEQSGTPESTVTKVFNRSIKSPTFDTLAPIARTLGVSLDTFSALAASGNSVSPKQSANDYYMRLLVECHNKHVATLEAQLKQKTKWNIAFVSMLFFTMGALIFFLIYDITHPSMGWIQYSTSRVLDGINAITNSLFRL